MVALVAAIPVCASAPQPAFTLADYEHLRNATTLDAPGKSPFHIKVEFQLFDLDGKPTTAGTVEEWWAPDVGARVVITSPSLNTTEPAPDGAPEQPASRDSGLIHQLLDQFIHPFSELRESKYLKLKDIKFKQATRKFGQASLNCIAVILSPDTPYPSTYCLDPGTENLRVESDAGTFSLTHNRVGVFRNSTVALDTVLSYAGRTSIEGHVVALHAIEAAAVGIAPGSGVPPVDPAQLAAGKKGGENPHYPAIAREQHISGSVVLAIIIGKDGKVRSLAPISSPDPSLTKAAMDGVRTWIYEPHLQNGAPVEFHSTVTVNFNLSP